MTKAVKLNKFLVEESDFQDSSGRIAEASLGLPEGWKWKSIGEICEINPSKKEAVGLPDDMEVTFVPMNAVSEVTGKIENPGIKRLRDVKKGYTYFREGDVLFAKITPCMENGKSAIARDLVNGLGFGSTEFHVIRPLNETIAEWIYYFVRQKSFRELAARNMTGSVGQQRVPDEFLESVKVPVPTLPEQRRIVARIREMLSKLEQTKKLRKEAIKDVKAVMQSALTQTFSNVGEKEWKFMKLKELGKVTSGGTPRRSAPQYFGGNISWFKAKELNDSYLTTSEETITDEGLRNSAAKLLPKDSIIIGMYDTAAGKLGMLSSVSTTNQACAALELTSNVIPKYCFYTLKHYRRRLIEERRGIRQRNLNLTMIKNFEIPVPVKNNMPALEEQRRIVSYLDKIQGKVEALKKHQQETEEEIEAVTQAVLEKALSGDL